MTAFDDIAESLAAHAVGAIMLLQIDSTDGFVRLVLGEDGYFVDISGNRWLGSKLLSMSEIESSLNGQAPAIQFTFTYTSDPTQSDLISAIRSYGVDSINGRSAKLYFQYLGCLEERLAPINSPILLASLIMRKLSYRIESDNMRAVDLVCEGPFPLRSRPVNGRYTDGDQQRRHAGDTSLEFIPTNGWDDQQLFDA